VPDACAAGWALGATEFETAGDEGWRTDWDPEGGAEGMTEVLRPGGIFGVEWMPRVPAESRDVEAEEASDFALSFPRP
jgi:hypothetical protein